MENWSVQTGAYRQTKHFVPQCDWQEYSDYLAAEKKAGRVIGWTAIPHPRGVSVIATHCAEAKPA